MDCNHDKVKEVFDPRLIRGVLYVSDHSVCLWSRTSENSAPSSISFFVRKLLFLEEFLVVFSRNDCSRFHVLIDSTYSSAQNPSFEGIPDIIEA